MFAASEKIKCATSVTELASLSGNPLVYFLGAAHKPTLQSIENIVFQKHSGRLVRLYFSSDLQLICDQEQRFYYEYDVKTAVFLICLIDCGGLGLALSLSEAYPKFLAQSCLFTAKKQEVPWEWQKIWFLQACNSQREALFHLQLLSLRYQLPIISHNFFKEPYSTKEISYLFQELQTMRRLPLLLSDFRLDKTPDFVGLHKENTDTVFGFYLLDYRYENGCGQHCCFVAADSLLDFPEPDLLQKVDAELYMFRQTFSNTAKIEAFLQEKFPHKKLCFMSRYYKAGRLFLAGRAARFFPGTKVLSLVRNQLGQLRYLSGEELQVDNFNCVDLCFSNAGAVFINQIAVLVGGTTGSSL